jgi:mitochondrial fission protein ELM1
MNILWLKDGKLGHEKQVQALLDEICKIEESNIYERKIENTYFLSSLNPFKSEIRKDCNILASHSIDMIVGAGHNTYSQILSYKENLFTIPKAIAILAPSFRKKDFDLICAPQHDYEKLKKLKNVIFFEGSLSKVSTSPIDESVGFIGLGGENSHYVFNEDSLLNQIQYIVSLFPNKKWFIFNSRRTPKSINFKISKLTNEDSNINFINFNDITTPSYNEIIKLASIKIVSPDSMNMVYESLSTLGKSYLFEMKSKSLNNKIVKQINKLKISRQIGYLEESSLVADIQKTKIHSQNEHNDVFAEVEKLAYKLIKKIKQQKK